MTLLPNVQCGYLAVSRSRGQQLKEPAQLDAWIKDGSKDYIESLCEFTEETANDEENVNFEYKTQAIL